MRDGGCGVRAADTYVNACMFWFIHRLDWTGLDWTGLDWIRGILYSSP